MRIQASAMTRERTTSRSPPSVGAGLPKCAAVAVAGVE